MRRVHQRGRCQTWAVWAVVLLGLGAALGAESEPEYRDRLARWAHELAAARRQAEAGDPGWREAVASLLDEAREPVVVRRGAGGPVTAEHGWLAQDLARALTARQASESASRLGLVERQLAAYRATVGCRSAPDEQHLREVLASVLPRGAGEPSRGALVWLWQALKWVAELLERLFARLSGVEGDALTWLFWVVVGAAGALAAAALALAVRLLLRRLGAGPPRSHRHVEIASQGSRPTPEALLARARQAAEAGAYGEAIRALYLAALMRLDREGFISYHPARTNWEYLRLLEQGEVRARFGSLTAIFDRKHYGGEVATPADYRQCEALFGRLVEAEVT